MHAAAYTGGSTELNVTSASRRIENSIYLLFVASWLCCFWNRCVPSLSSHTRKRGGVLSLTPFSLTQPRTGSSTRSENGRTSRTVKLLPLFLFRDHCQSAKASGTFCSPSRRNLLRTFAHVTQCCRFEAFAHRGGWVSWSLVGASCALRGVSRLFRRHRLPDALPFSD